MSRICRFWLVFLLVLVVPSLSLAAPKQVSTGHGEMRVFSNKQEYDQAVSKQKATRLAQKELPLSDSQRAERAREIELAFNQVDQNDVAAVEKIARKYGLYVYNPNLEAPISAQSSACCSVTIPAPTITYDMSLDSHYVRGEMRWNDDTQLSSDIGLFTNIGGPDTAGLWFTYLTQYDLGNIWRQTFDTYNKAGAWKMGGTTPDWSPSGGSQVAILFSGQDATSTGTVSGYNFYKAVTYVWFNYDDPDGGLAYMTYAHTWNSTNLTGVDFGANVECCDSKVVKGGASMTFRFDRVENKWAVGGTALSY